MALFCKLGNIHVRKVNVSGEQGSEIETGIEPKSLLFFSRQISELKILLKNEIVNVCLLFL